MVCLNRSPIRQGPTTLSTAESELQELVEGMVAGQSCYALFQETFSQIGRVREGLTASLHCRSLELKGDHGEHATCACARTMRDA